MRIAFKEYNEIMSIIEGSYHKAALKLHCTDSEIHILYMLNVYPNGCNQSALYTELGLTKSTVNSTLKKMEKNGFINIVPAKGRNTWVSATKSGKQLIKNTIHQIIQIENEIFDTWSKEEQEMFIRLNKDFSNKLADKVNNMIINEATIQSSTD